jgi:hypothetical protein
MLNIPDNILLVDVSPRDGLQSLPKWIPTDDKVWLRSPDGSRCAVVGWRRAKVACAMRKVLARIKRGPASSIAARRPTCAVPRDRGEGGQMLGLITVSETYTHHI